MNDIDKKEMEACKRWINRDFSNVPLPVIQKLFNADPDSVTLVSSEYPDDGCSFFPMWGWLFNPCDSLDEAWIKEHLEEVEEVGFFVYEQEDYGILLGINSCGTCFYESYWVPLYRLRGFAWHQSHD